MKHFSLKHSTDFLSISKSGGQLSLDSSGASGKGQSRHLRPWSESLPAPSPAYPWTRQKERPRGGSPHHPGSVVVLARRSSERLPSSPDAGPSRIVRKEFAANEENPQKQIWLRPHSSLSLVRWFSHQRQSPQPQEPRRGRAQSTSWCRRSQPLLLAACRSFRLLSRAWRLLLVRRLEANPCWGALWRRHGHRHRELPGLAFSWRLNQPPRATTASTQRGPCPNALHSPFGGFPPRHPDALLEGLRCFYLDKQFNVGHSEVPTELSDEE